MSDSLAGEVILGIVFTIFVTFLLVKFSKRPLHHHLPAYDVMKGHHWCYTGMFSKVGYCLACPGLQHCMNVRLCCDFSFHYVFMFCFFHCDIPLCSTIRLVEFFSFEPTYSMQLLVFMYCNFFIYFFIIRIWMTGCVQILVLFLDFCFSIIFY